MTKKYIDLEELKNVASKEEPLYPNLRGLFEILMKEAERMKCEIDFQNEVLETMDREIFELNKTVRKLMEQYDSDSKEYKALEEVTNWFRAH